MAQTTILASAQTAATSSDITLAQGETRTVGIFSSAAKWKMHVKLYKLN